MIGIVPLKYLKKEDIISPFFSPTSHIRHRVEPVVCFVGKALDGWSVGDGDDAFISRRD